MTEPSPNNPDSQSPDQVGSSSLGDLLAKKREISGVHQPIGASSNIPSNHPRRTVPTEPEKIPRGCIVLPTVFILLLTMMWAVWDSSPLPTRSSWAGYEAVFVESLSRNAHKEFGLDFENEFWASRTLTIPATSEFNTSWIFSYDGTGETASHFPGVPYLRAASEYLMLEPDWLTHSLGDTFLAIGLTLLLYWLLQEFGWIAFCVGLGIVLIDGPLLKTTYPSTTWITGCLVTGFALFAMGVCSLQKSQRSIWAWPISGACLGAATLFGLHPNGWLCAALIAWLAWLIFQLILRNSKPSKEAFVLFWIGALIIATPWWIRNIGLTGNPIGTYVSTKTGESDSDRSLEINGNLDIQNLIKDRENFLISLSQKELTLIEKEALFSEKNATDASTWKQANPTQTIALMGKRLATLLGINERFEMGVIPVTPILVVAGTLGCLMTWRRVGGAIVILLVASIIVTLFTWSDYGRNLIPMRALLAAGVGMGVAKILEMTRFKASTRSLNI